MTRGNKVFIVMVVAILGIWGCNQGSPGGNAGWEKVKALEGENNKLKEEAKAAEDSRNQVRKKLGEAEAARAKLQKTLDEQQTIARERDELKQQMSLRTAERDALQGQIEQLRKGIRGLLSQVDAASSLPVTAAATTSPGAGG